MQCAECAHISKVFVLKHTCIWFSFPSRLHLNGEAEVRGPCDPIPGEFRGSCELWPGEAKRLYDFRLGEVRGSCDLRSDQVKGHRDLRPGDLNAGASRGDLDVLTPQLLITHASVSVMSPSDPNMQDAISGKKNTSIFFFCFDLYAHNWPLSDQL